MSSLASGVGLISGLPISDLVNRLVAFDQAPIDRIDQRVKDITTLRTALLDISARLLSLKGIATSLKTADFFRGTTATSSNESILRVTPGTGATPGEYRFIVRQLASSHQLLGNGFATSDQTYLNAGTLTIESAAGRLDKSTSLATLRGGQGVRGGVIKITDRSGTSVNVDLTAARNIEDIVGAINGQDTVAVRARIQGDALVLEDNTGRTTGTITVADVGGGQTAANLGLAGTSTTGTIVGSDLVVLSGNTRLGDLNDGNGVRRLGVGADFRIHAANGTTLDVDLSGRLNSTTSLLVLNSGAGVTAGSIRITNRAGVGANVDLSGAQTVGDVLTAINGAGLSITASVTGGKIVLNDVSTGSGATTVAEVGAGTTARDLGLVGTSTTGTITGSAVYRIETLGDVLNIINNDPANAGRLRASLSTDAKSLVLTDTTTGSTAFQVEALGGSKAAKDLGLLGTGTGGTIRSGRLLAGLDSVLLRSLRGGAGIQSGVIRLTDRSGASATVDVSNAQSLSDVVTAINNAGTGVRVSLSESGLGLQITDASGGSGTLTIDDQSGHTAEQLGIKYSGTNSTVRGGNLQRQYVSEATRLDQLDNGRGIPRGLFRITNAAGETAVVDLTQGNEVTVQDVLDEINSRGIGVTARINDNGDGILLTDTSTGTGRLTVTEEGGGTTAKALRLLGTAASGVTAIDGSYETRIVVGPSDTLQSLVTKIQASGAYVGAGIVNDGSAGSAFHLILTSLRTGVIGRLAVDAGTTGLTFGTLSRGRDSIVQVGTGDDSTGFVISSSTNTIDNAIPGATLNLTGSSSEPVSVTIAADTDGIVKKVSSLAQAFNAILSRLDDLSTFNANTGARGVLLGDRSADQVRTRVQQFLTQRVPGLAVAYSRLSSIGFSFSNGQVVFDETKFRAAYAANPDAVTALFSQETSGLGASIGSQIDELAGSDNGILARRGQSLSDTADSLNGRKAQLQALLESHRARLLAQFQATEVALARLQSQQTALGTLSSLAASFSASSQSSGR